MTNFRISTQTAPWYNEKEPFESLQFIKECGFDAIDLSFKNFFLEEYNKENLTSFYDNGIDAVIDHYRPLKEAAEKLDVQIFQAHSHFPVYVKNNPEETEYLLKVAEMMIAVCDFLNCRNIVIHPFYYGSREDFNYDDEKQINLGIYRRLIPLAKKHNVTFCS
jgi:sugar phosphate isomerase/epimerase